VFAELHRVPNLSGANREQGLAPTISRNPCTERLSAASLRPRKSAACSPAALIISLTSEESGSPVRPQLRTFSRFAIAVGSVPIRVRTPKYRS